MSASQVEIARRMYQSRQHTVEDIARTLGGSSSSIYRYVGPGAERRQQSAQRDGTALRAESP